MSLFASGMCDENFTTLPLQREIPNISSMNAGGGTAAYQGVIRGAQILLDGKPSDAQGDEIEDYFERSQMLLILSDGREDPFTNTFSQLVDAGLCQNIREEFQEHKSPLYIGVIGIAFNAEGQTAFQNCADEVIDVDNSNELLEKIQELIKKGAETNGVSRLYDKNQ
jgi:tight adherence protein G